MPADREVIAKQVRRAAPIVLDVDLRRVDGGWKAFVTLDPVVVRARAGQQSLADRSVAGAAASPRVQRALAHSIEVANGRLTPDHQVVRFAIVAEEAHDVRLQAARRVS